jgi:ribosomal protein S18 acetylase RimI-like enzyme
MQVTAAQSKITIGAAATLGVPSDAIAAFYETNWTRRIALAIPSYYRWQFCEAPGSKGLDHCAVAIGDRDEIVGVMGVTPRPFILAGLERKAAEMTTWVVAESARGRGVGQGILQFLQSEYDVLLGAGISDAAIPLYRTAGFRFVRRLPRYVRIFRKLSAGFMKATPLGDRLLEDRISVASSVRAEEITAVEVSSIVQSALSGLNRYARDSETMRWRYDRHPAFRYRFFRVEDAAIVGLREDRVGDTGFVHVVECFGDERALPSAVAFIDRFCIDNDLYFADATCVASAISRFLLAAGWFSILDDSEIQVTSLFHPLEFRDPPTTSLMLWSREAMSDLLDIGRLYFVKGDLDLDRPTYAYYETHGLLGNA